MSYNRRANNIGLSTNIGLESSAISSSNPSINNNIVINSANGESGLKDNITERNIENPYVNYPSVSNFTPQNIPHTEFMPPLTKDNAILESKLLNIFTQILLSDNKRLLSNIVSKQKIILSKADLESIVSILVGKKVNIELEDPESNCLSCITSALDFGKISAIKIIDDDVVVDFKLVHNKEYNELTNKYHLSLKYIII